ncbi:indole-3-glycerol phosphate synthase TrpC [Fulvivirga sediminis]|uniref:Indole-3-glycerol phosphate synthase n=1 Tax=Fulvivirga sediminis TaxID=2803949 RepID=A0A937FAI1_9BACT|nr:indole-3-glycerol phosphate synthase TrpC [Fulvivirga sediminis]MBL3658685.1 indole-3-glycerol phosphate synthase TrpC [Fulvivirga sediminis]
MNILEEIVAHKRKEVSEKKNLFPVRLLEQSIFFHTQSVSLKKYILREDKSGIIAEIKRKSPSKGVINPNVSIERTSIGYMQAGASALSVLTDTKFFGGKNEDLTTARKFNFCPILRKDFTVDEYQIIEAKSIGADAILLIAAVLTPEEVKSLAKLAHSLGLEVLLEVHNEAELERSFNEYIDLLGVNNRDLASFKVDLNTSISLSEKVPHGVVKVAESGINQPEDIELLKSHGFEGFLIGERFMRSARPEKSAESFIEKLSLHDKVNYAKA